MVMNFLLCKKSISIKILLSRDNNALHLTAIPLRSRAVSELYR
jgi:hypothetical protein